MAVPRRRLVRAAILPEQASPQRHRQIQKLRDRLDRERMALARWQTRLKRAFNATEKCQRKIARMEKQLNHLEG